MDVAEHFCFGVMAVEDRMLQVLRRAFHDPLVALLFRTIRRLTIWAALASRREHIEEKVHFRIVCDLIK